MKKPRIGINGFGRIGRLTFRAAWNWPEFDWVVINDPKGGAECAAHLLTFDSVQGRWSQEAVAEGRDAIRFGDRRIAFTEQPKPGDVDWEEIFGKQGSQWFHTGGIFAALSETTAELTIEACKAAKKHGTIVSYDLNYRPSLWKSIGGLAKAQEVNREIAKYVDVMIGNEEDFTASLGFEVEGVSEHVTGLEVDSFKNMIKNAVADFPNFQVVATTLRDVHSATVNDWGAICWHDGEFHEATHRPKMEIYDRVGGGDSFASGLVYGFMEFNDAKMAVEYGAAHGALAMTTPGDTTMATADEVKKLVGGGSARVDR